MSALLDALMAAGSGALDVLDMPGSYTRGLLAGRPGDRLSGRDMLEEWGVLDENQEGLDAGDVAGFGADLLVDPLNLLGGAGVLKQLGKRLPRYGGSPEILDNIIQASPLSSADRINSIIVNKNLRPLVASMQEAVANPKFGPSSPYFRDNYSALSHFLPDDADTLVDFLGRYNANPMRKSEPAILGAVENFYNAKHIAKRLSESPHAGDIASHIPPESQLLGAGAESLALRTPHGDVLKIHGPNLDDALPQMIPPKIPEVLQPTHYKNIGDWAVGRYPMVETKRVGSDVVEELTEKIESQGFKNLDIGDTNIGFYEGRPVVFDAGAVGYKTGMKPGPQGDPRIAPILAALLGYNTANVMN